MSSIAKWLLRVEHLLLVIGFFVLTANTVYAVQTSDMSKFLLTYLFLTEHFQSLQGYVHSLSPIQSSSLILAGIGILFFIALYRWKKRMSVFFTMSFVFFLIALYSFFPYLWEKTEALYQLHYSEVAVFGIIAVVLIIRFLLLTKSGRSYIRGMIKALLEFSALSTILFYIGTFQFDKIYQGAYLVWSETEFSFQYLSLYLDWGSLLYIGFVICSLNFYTVVGVLNYRKRKAELKLRGFTSDEILPHIGITIPAYNEEQVIIPTIEAALQSIYPSDKKDILVVCDGSTDRTPEKVIKHYSMYPLSGDLTHPIYRWIRTKPVDTIWASDEHPNFRLIIKKNGGKHDALNTGLNYHRAEVTHVMHLDADTILDKLAVRQLAVEIARNKKELLAVAGTILPEFRSATANTFKEWINKFRSKSNVEWQRLDYITSFHISRGSLALMNSILIISGAFGLFNRASLLSLLGYRKGLGEDMDVTLKLQQDRVKRKKGKIIFVPESVAYTAAPLTLKELSGQRVRWFKGLIECLSRFKKLLFSRLGLAFLHFLLIEFLTPLLVPIGILNILVRPEILSSPVFIAAISLLILTSLVSTVTAVFIENKYRPINWGILWFLPTQLIFTPLSFIWRNDAFLQFKDKSWGVIKKSFQ